MPRRREIPKRDIEADPFVAYRDAQHLVRIDSQIHHHTTDLRVLHGVKQQLAYGFEQQRADVVACREGVVAAVLGAGYGYVTLDLEGLRSGNLNRALREVPAVAG